MNILPKKRWHVRTKENIARVRRDEAKAAEEEKSKQDRVKLAEREARRELLLARSRENVTSKSEFIPLSEEKDQEQASSDGHINFFQELEDGTAELKQSNKEHDKEQKEEREKYEKQIGYLTYLGQDTNESLGKKSWYDVVPDRSTSVKNEVNLKSKIREDPLLIMKKYTSLYKNIYEARKNNTKSDLYKSVIHTNHTISSRKRKRSNSNNSHTSNEDKQKKRKHKKHTSRKEYDSDSKSSENEESEDETERLKKKQKLEMLRLERLKREREERRRTEELMAKLRGEEKNICEKPAFKPKYNSQFNPELAKQNYGKNK